MEYSDDELILLFQDKNKSNYAFNLIVLKYQKRLYWHIRKIVITHEDTDDILQNTFIKALNGLNKFNKESQLYTWLYRIATNESLNFLKQKRMKYFLPLVDVEKQLSETLESDFYFNGDELSLKLQKAILTLPKKQRIIFNMRYFDEMKYEEISAILKITVGALKASFHHAMKKIEKCITEN